MAQFTVVGVMIGCALASCSGYLWRGVGGDLRRPSREGVVVAEANRTSMLLRNRPPGIDSTLVHRREGFEHLEHRSLVVLRWLNANKVDYVLVGAVARAIRGDDTAVGPVAIVPAPYGRNFERLARALTAEHAGLRSERGLPGGDSDDVVVVKLTGDKLARGRRWKLAFGDYHLDLEAAGPPVGAEDPAGAAGPPASGGSRSIGASGGRYQELLYESSRFTLSDGLTVEVASPEDLEHYAHVRRTGSAPEFRVTRGSGAGRGPAAEASQTADAGGEGHPAGEAGPAAGDGERGDEPRSPAGGEGGEAARVSGASESAEGGGPAPAGDTGA